MQQQQQFRELDFYVQQYRKTIINLVIFKLDNIENIDHENFFLSDNDDTDIDNEVNERSNENTDFINNTHTQSITSINEWRNMITNWTEMIENEPQDQDTEIIDLIDTYDISVNNIDQLQHPAIDLQAKWSLKDIFVESLELPNYLEDFIIDKN